MTDYREILRLRSLGFNHTQIAESLACSRTTVIGVLKQAQLHEVTFQSASTLSDKDLAARLFPAESAKPAFRMPDYARVYHEISKSSVTL